jgi:diguanylate cyclase (GGDEF)-like protein
MGAPIPENEESRLLALRSYNVLDTLPEQVYNDVALLASCICKTPMALISLVDSYRQWFKAGVGLDIQETPREHSFCAHAILNPAEVMVVNDASQDERFAQNPLVQGDPHIRFYSGAPLVTPTGEAVGALCVIDRQPRQMSADEKAALRALSHLVVSYLELRRSIAVLEKTTLEQEEYVQQLEQYQRVLEANQAQLEARSVTDGLTQIANRAAFQSRLEEEFYLAQRHDSPLSLVLLDVDHFKSYNDTFGHPAGDEVLCSVARILKTNIRAHDIVARYGGEEFAVILPATSREGALIMGERIRRAIQQASWSLRKITVSVGLGIMHNEMSTATELLTSADKALYQAKAQGRNRVSLQDKTENL